MTTPIYLDIPFENGSPAEWETEGDHGVMLMPLYDHARGSVNRQMTSWHVYLHCTTARRVHLRIPPVESIYDGQWVLELNSNHCAGAGCASTSAVWKAHGRQFALALAAHLRSPP